MARVKKTKKIKIMSKGFVFTSRGRCRTPILRPYVENCDVILQMLTRDNASIVEVLNDGTEVKLNIHNFASNNEEPLTEKKVEIVEEKPRRPLTRKERRELERKEREAAQKAKQAEAVNKAEEQKPEEAEEDTKLAFEPVSVPEDSIEE